MSSNGLGSLTTSQINQIKELASNQDSEKDVLVAQFNGKEISFTAIRPRVGSDANQEKPVEGSDLAVQTLGLKDRNVSPALANKLIQAHKRTAPEDVIFVDMRDITLLREHVVDSVKDRRSSSNTLHSDWGSTTSLDSGYSSLYGSTESLNEDVDLPGIKQLRLYQKKLLN